MRGFDIRKRVKRGKRGFEGWQVPWFIRNGSDISLLFISFPVPPYHPVGITQAANNKLTLALSLGISYLLSSRLGILVFWF